jgi:hypothetical protein
MTKPWFFAGGLLFGAAVFCCGSVLAGEVPPLDDSPPTRVATEARSRPSAPVDSLAEEGKSATPSPQGLSPTARPPMRTPAERLAAARRAVEELRYDDASASVTGIGPDAPPKQRVQALELRAAILLIRGRTAVAQPLLEELFFLAPAFRLSDPSLPPRVTKMFEEEAARPHKRGVVLELEPVGTDLRRFALRAGGATRRVTLACRVGDRAPYLPMATRLEQGRAAFRLPNEGVFHCHAVAFDRDGLPLGRFGTARAPFVLRSRSPPVVPALTERWWFWTAVSGVVVSAVVVSAVVLTAQDSPPDADITVQIPSSTTASLVRW